MKSCENKITNILLNCSEEEIIQYFTEIEERHPSVARKRAEVILKRAEERQSRLCFVYGLYKNNELIYIGSTVNPRERRLQHEKRKPHDNFRILYKGPHNEMRELESKLISEEKPRLNKVGNH